MATRNPNATLSYTLLDASGEKSVMQLNSIEFNITTIPGDLTAIGDFRDSIALSSGGTIEREIFTQFNTRYNAVKPTDKNFQRERKWLVRYQDDVTFNTYRLEIPCARVVGTASAPLVDAFDNAIVTAPDWVAWIADFEQVARSQDGNFVTFLDAKLVGRNL
jgi:hypothetical protein